MIKYITLGIVALVIAVPLYAGYNIQSTALPEPSALYNRLSASNTIANEAKADYNLLRSSMLYRFCHYICDENDVALGLYTQEISLSEADDIRAITAEMCVNGVMKWLNNTAEIHSWKSADTLEAGEACIYLFSWDGSSATVGSSITVTQGTECSSLEVATYPACPANEVPFGALWIETATSAFVPGTTDFGSLSSTLETIFGPMPGGASAPTAISASDLSLIDQ